MDLESKSLQNLGAGDNEGQKRETLGQEIIASYLKKIDGIYWKIGIDLAAIDSDEKVKNDSEIKKIKKELESLQDSLHSLQDDFNAANVDSSSDFETLNRRTNEAVNNYERAIESLRKNTDRILSEEEAPIKKTEPEEEIVSVAPEETTPEETAKKSAENQELEKRREAENQELERKKEATLVTIASAIEQGSSLVEKLTALSDGNEAIRRIREDAIRYIGILKSISANLKTFKSPNFINRIIRDSEYTAGNIKKLEKAAEIEIAKAKTPEPDSAKKADKKPKEIIGEPIADKKDEEPKEAEKEDTADKKDEEPHVESKDEKIKQLRQRMKDLTEKGEVGKVAELGKELIELSKGKSETLENELIRLKQEVEEAKKGDNPEKSAALESRIKRLEEAKLRIEKRKQLQIPEGDKQSMAKVAGSVAYKTITSVFSVKTFTDLILMARGKGDIYNYFKQKKETKQSKQEIESALREMAKEAVARRTEKKTAEKKEADNDGHEKLKSAVSNFKERIEKSTKSGYLSKAEASVFQAQLALIMAEHTKKAEDLNDEKKEDIKKILDAYLHTKISGWQIAKDGLNAFLTLGIATASLRGVSYGLTALGERAQKASQKFGKEELERKFRDRKVVDKDETKEKDGKKTSERSGHIKYVLKDIFVNSKKEKFHALTLHRFQKREIGREITGKQKAIDFMQAFGTLARAYGIGGTALRGINSGNWGMSEGVNKLLDNLQEKGFSEGLRETVISNFMANSERMLLAYTRPIEFVKSVISGEKETPSAVGGGAGNPGGGGQVPETYGPTQREVEIQEALNKVKAENELTEIKNLKWLGAVDKGEGAWDPVHRQLSYDLKLHPEHFGLKPEDLTNPQEENHIKSILAHKTQELLIKNGFIKPDGTEVRMSNPGEVVLVKDGKIEVQGKTYEWKKPEVKIAEKIEPQTEVHTESLPPEELITKPNIIPERVYARESLETLVHKPEATIAEKVLLQQIHNYEGKTDLTGVYAKEAHNNAAKYLISEADKHPDYLEKYPELKGTVREVYLERLEKELGEGEGALRFGGPDSKDLYDGAIKLAKFSGLEKGNDAMLFAEYLRQDGKMTRGTFSEFMEGKRLSGQRISEKIGAFKKTADEMSAELPKGDKWEPRNVRIGFRDEKELVLLKIGKEEGTYEYMGQEKDGALLTKEQAEDLLGIKKEAVLEQTPNKTQEIPPAEKPEVIPPAEQKTVEASISATGQSGSIESVVNRTLNTSVSKEALEHLTVRDFLANDYYHKLATTKVSHNDAEILRVFINNTVHSKGINEGDMGRSVADYLKDHFENTGSNMIMRPEEVHIGSNAMHLDVVVPAGTAPLQENHLNNIFGGAKTIPEEIKTNVTTQRVTITSENSPPVTQEFKIRVAADNPALTEIPIKTSSGPSVDHPKTITFPENNTIRGNDIVIPGGTKAHFIYDELGKPKNIDFESGVGDPKEVLNNGWERKIKVSLDKMQTARDTITFDAGRIVLQKELLNSMQDKNSAEAQFLREQIENKIQSIETRYGDIFRDSKEIIGDSKK